MGRIWSMGHGLPTPFLKVGKSDLSCVVVQGFEHILSVCSYSLYKIHCENIGNTENYRKWQSCAFQRQSLITLWRISLSSWFTIFLCLGKIVYCCMLFLHIHHNQFPLLLKSFMNSISTWRFCSAHQHLLPAAKDRLNLGNRRLHFCLKVDAVDWMLVSPQIHTLKLNWQQDGIRRWSLWEVIWSWWWVLHECH